MHMRNERNVNFMDKNFMNDINIIQHEEIPKGYKLNPKYIETKSKRVQLLTKPSTHEKLKAVANNNNVSVNELINNILESYINSIC